MKEADWVALLGKAEHHSEVVSTLASYFGSPGFKS
jgi:hypothetical protein